MKKSLFKYRGFIIVVFGLIILTLVNNPLGFKAINVTLYSFKEMVQVIPPIFILLGLLDVWIPKETMIKYMGEGSGIKGIFLAIFIGSAAAGPLYGAFPIAAVFMKKGVSFRNIMIFIGAWSTTKIPMFLFELTSLGAKFAITRLLVDIPGIIIIAMILNRLVSKEDVIKIYETAQSFDA